MFKFVQPRGLPNYNTHIYTPSWEMLLNMITTRNLTLKPMCSSQKWRKKHLSPVPRTLASKFTTLSETTGDWGRAELQCCPCSFKEASRKLLSCPSSKFGMDTGTKQAKGRIAGMQALTSDGIQMYIFTPIYLLYVHVLRIHLQSFTSTYIFTYTYRYILSMRGCN